MQSLFCCNESSHSLHGVQSQSFLVHAWLIDLIMIDDSKLEDDEDDKSEDRS